MLVVALSILPCVVMLFYRHPLLLLYLWPLFIVITPFVDSTAEVEGSTQLPILLQPMDPVYFFTIMHLGLCALLKPKRLAGILRENRFLSIFLLMVALYVVIYTPTYGKSAIGEARKFYFMFLFPLLALLSIRTPENLRRFVQVVILTSAAVAVIALGLAAMRGSIIRVVNSEHTLIVALAAIAMAVHRFHGVVVFHPKIDRVMLFLFAVLTIGSGQRSVWLAIGFGLIIAFWLQRGRPRTVIKSGVLALAILIVGGSALVYFPTVGERLGAKFAGLIDPSSDNTASWRIEGWRQQLDRLQQRGQLLFGAGLGGYYWWKEDGRGVLASPHNAYIQAILKFGLFGLTIYGLLALQFFRKVLRARKTLGPGPKAYVDMGILTFGAAQGYFLGYGFEAVTLIYFAVALSAVKLSEKSRSIPWFGSISRLTYSYPAYQGYKRSQPTASPQSF